MAIAANIEEISNKFEQVLGKKAWNVKLGVGSFITMEFGTPHEAQGGHLHGEWHLWVYDCAWRLETSESVLAASEDERDVIKSAIKHLEGVQIDNIEIFPPALETNMKFRGGYTLRLFPIYSSDAEHWMLFTPSGKTLVIGPGMDWSYQDTDRQD